MNFNLRNLAGDRRGNVAMMFGLALPVILMATGSAVDYSLAMRQQARLDAIADAAALSAVSATAMQQNDATAATTAEDLFQSEGSSLPNTTLGATPGCAQANTKPCVTITHPGGTNQRTAVVAYHATYATIFSGILGVTTLNLSGSATAVSAASPNTNFYLLLDNSSSMTIPATTAGIASLQSATVGMSSSTQGCAFACHMTNPQWSNPSDGTQGYQYGLPCLTKNARGQCLTWEDPYTYAENNKITLRFDEVQSAVNGVIADAQSQQAAATVAPWYQFEIDSIDSPTAESSASPNFYSVMPLCCSSSATGYVSQWSSKSSGLAINEEYDWDYACTSSACNSGNDVNNGRGLIDNGFFSSRLSQAIVGLSKEVPVAGTGSGGSTPQEVVMIVTDGVEDYINGGPVANPTIAPLSATGQAACTTLKANGVKVAVLYTTYYPIPGFWLYDDYVSPNISPTDKFSAALNSCASPGLFMTAAVGDDIAAELKQLFEIASGSSKLTQ